MRLPFRLAAWLVVPAVAAAFSGCAVLEHLGPPLATAPDFDLARYAGSWYEIARYPNRFQRGCANVVATYTSDEDGSFRVHNACDREARRDTIEGRAWPAGDDPARLRVRFFWPLFAPYWVLAVGPSYEWALVGTPDRDFLWVLSRTPSLDPATYEAIAAIARERGFDPAKLERTPQGG
jgi:apolipoprotein D and lipocalin family protein